MFETIELNANVLDYINEIREMSEDKDSMVEVFGPEGLDKYNKTMSYSKEERDQYYAEAARYLTILTEYSYDDAWTYFMGTTSLKKMETVMSIELAYKMEASMVEMFE